MVKEHSTHTKEKRTMDNNNATGGAVYALGIIGAAVYFIQVADNLGEGAFGLLKALFWPAFLVYELLVHLAV